MTDVLVVDPRVPERALLERAVDCLRRGGLVAFPTETVYGLGVNALDGAAVRRLFEAKGRPANDPLIVHVTNIDAAREVARELPDTARSLASRFWPGPLTVVLPKSPTLPPAVTAGLDSVGVRVPAHPIARALIEMTGLPIAAPSANLFSRPSPTRAAHVLQDLDGRIDLVVDGGATSLGVESTVLDLTQPVPVILRPGAITREMLEAVIGPVEVRNHARLDGTTAMPAPGMLEKHYSPRAPLTLYEGGSAAAVLDRLLSEARRLTATGRRVGVLAADEDVAPLSALGDLHIESVGSLGRLDDVAANLYAALRALDATGVPVILARAFPSDSGLGLAVADRLRRAAAGRIVRVD